MTAIVVGVDRSETSMRAAAVAADLARSTGIPLHVVTAVQRRTATEVHVGTDSFRVDALTNADEFVSGLARRLGGPTATWSVHTGDAADAVCAEARRTNATYIVVGNRRAQGAARVLGSVAAGVMHHAPCHVVVANTSTVASDHGDRSKVTGALP